MPSSPQPSVKVRYPCRPIDCNRDAYPHIPAELHRKARPVLDVLDLILLAVGLGSLALSMAYAYKRL
jgi:hypothetical protein